MTRLIDGIVEACVESTKPKTETEHLRLQAAYYDGIAEAMREKAEIARAFAGETEGNKKAPAKGEKKR